MAYIGRRFNIGKMSPFEIKIGGLSKQLGGNKNIRQFAEIFFPTLSWKQFSGTLGFKSLGQNPLFPDLNIKFKQGPLQLSYQTLQVIDERSWEPIYLAKSLQYISGFLKLPQLEIFLGGWQGAGAAGYHGKVLFQLPWQMEVSIGAATVNQPLEWIFSNKQLSWEIDQDITLFNDALYSHLKIWGNHYQDTQIGILDAETSLVRKSYFPGEDVLHLLNYTISAEVSSVIIGFTDSNMLQDDLWSQYGDVSWNPSFSIMANQLPETRFRYFSLIWVFDN